MSLIDFINRNFIEGIVNDTSYNHFDMITYVIILFAGVLAITKLLNKLRIKVDEEFVIATIPFIFMGSVYRVIEDADILKPPVKYFFITPLIFFVIFAICFGTLLVARYLEKRKKIKNYIHTYAITGLILSLAGVVILIFNTSSTWNPGILVYALVPAIALTEIVKKISPVIGMTYLRSRMYSFAIFSFLLDSFTTYIGVDLLGYTNKHPFSSFLTSIVGTGAVLIPLSLVLVMLIILMLEKDSTREKNTDEKYMLTLTLIVLGFSMGARNLLAMVFGV
ncbi:hypothetical protein METP2_02040 [Methanosarcinales archaeon]|nr:DUF63 family protein [Candidatus Methanoperedens sp. BLZ2]KAB2940764.1 MAG: DUF63 family protein [Candidatus Methanoperedens sp.]MBZ0176249.1 DUF63 family protein [Candidatus Methanoperedens nitroreducens]CAG0982107.1 hypothetical protein METP2_02040 [Methanosarcinales archaeon]MCX9077268.1 DUF63 family protein [Candidatus Methanoperedens sp.]MCX9088143.1 DUF63 family protein [Candidatus Methanoperedens sp.]